MSSPVIAPTSLPATVRLAQSRDALRKAMQEDAPESVGVNRPLAAPDSIWLVALQLLKAKPGAFLLAQTVQQLWAKNAWRILAQSTAEAAGIVLTPVAQRSPLKLVAGAFVVGGLLYFIRPWRMVTKSSVVAAVLGR